MRISQVDDPRQVQPRDWDWRRFIQTYMCLDGTAVPAHPTHETYDGSEVLFGAVCFGGDGAVPLQLSK